MRIRGLRALRAEHFVCARQLACLGGLRALRAEHFACVRQLACLTEENLQLRTEIDSHGLLLALNMGDFFLTKLPAGHAILSMAPALHR